jgi:hypothetical protein
MTQTFKYVQNPKLFQEIYDVHDFDDPSKVTHGTEEKDDCAWKPQWVEPRIVDSQPAHPLEAEIGDGYSVS